MTYLQKALICGHCRTWMDIVAAINQHYGGDLTNVNYSPIIVFQCVNCGKYFTILLKQE